MIDTATFYYSVNCSRLDFLSCSEFDTDVLKIRSSAVPFLSSAAHLTGEHTPSRALRDIFSFRKEKLSLVGSIEITFPIVPNLLSGLYCKNSNVGAYVKCNVSSLDFVVFLMRYRSEVVAAPLLFPLYSDEPLT